MELTALSLSAAAALLRAGEVSSVQLTEAALQRTAAALPPEDPPGTRAKSNGLRVGP